MHVALQYNNDCMGKARIGVQRYNEAGPLNRHLAPSFHFVPVSTLLAFREQLLDIPVKPVPSQYRLVHLPCPFDPTATFLITGPTPAIKWLRQRPIGAWVEETEHLPFPQRAIPPHADLELLHVPFERGVAGVVDKVDVAVEFHVQVGSRLGRAVALRALLVNAR